MKLNLSSTEVRCVALEDEGAASQLCELLSQLHPQLSAQLLPAAFLGVLWKHSLQVFTHTLNFSSAIPESRSPCTWHFMFSLTARELGKTKELDACKSDESRLSIWVQILRRDTVIGGSIIDTGLWLKLNAIIIFAPKKQQSFRMWFEQKINLRLFLGNLPRFW